MKKIILIGAGGHAKTCIDVIEQQKKYKISFLLDTKIKKKILLKYKILSEQKFANSKKNVKHIFVSIGQIKNSKIREIKFNKFKKLGFNFPIIKSPNAYVSKNCSIKEGTLIAHGCIVNSGVIVGHNTILNNRSLLDHDVVVGNNCHISTGAILNGNVKIGSNTFIGSGTIIKENVSIGNNCIIGAGLTIKNNIKSFSIKKNNG